MQPAADCPAAYEGQRLGSFDLDIVRPYAVVAPGGCSSYTGHPLLSFICAVAVVVAVTLGSVRYRAPAEVPIVVLAAVGVDAVWVRLRGRASNAARNASTTSAASASVMSV
jgi:hypothetical protein